MCLCACVIFSKDTIIRNKKKEDDKQQEIGNERTNDLFSKQKKTKEEEEEEEGQMPKYKKITTIGSMRQVCCSLGMINHWMDHDVVHRLLAPRRRQTSK